MIIVTDIFLERLGGEVKGKKRSYKIEVKHAACKPKVEVELDQCFEITATDSETGTVTKTEVFRARDDNRISDLEFLVKNFKLSASNDFIPT